MKLKKYYKKIKNFIKSYINNNKLFTEYILINTILTILVRCFTTKKVFTLYPLFVDVGLIIILGSFNFFFKKEKKRYIYLQCLTSFYTLICTINAFYYSFYASFASISELSSVGQTTNVTGSLFEKLTILHFIYLLFPLIFYFLHKKLKKKKVEFSTNKKYLKKKVLKTALIGLIIVALAFITAQKQDYSRLYKQWNRPYVVNRFGIILYQTMDLINFSTSKITTMFGLDDALIETQTYYKNNTSYKESNKYTGLLEGYNIIFVHMESIQSFLLDLSFNGEDVLPTVKSLINEGMYFSNFYPQISIGTSSDTEFTLLSSLLPTNTGIVFTNFSNRNYVTLPKMLNEKGYYTFSMHGNEFTMWDRNKAHPSLGYQGFYYKDKYTFNEEESINLGISDDVFFKQSIDYLEQIERENTNYMGTVITLSNHSPFIYLDKYKPFDLSKTYRVYNKETNRYENKKIDYLTGSTVGNYIISSHSADLALGEFVNDIKESNYFNNTIFVFYGDHDPRLTIDQYNYYYNYDPITKDLLDKNDPNYYDYNDAKHILNKKTPLIIWSKNEQIRNLLQGEITSPMGMIDVFPTLGNMLGIKNKYALGHDIFNIKDKNIVVFPNGSYITGDYLYDCSNDNIYTLKNGIRIKEKDIQKGKDYSDKIISISNNIIRHDLIEIIEKNKKPK